MRKMKQELILSDAGKRLTDFCIKYFGTVKNAAIYFEIPYLTLWRNCKKPTGAWICMDRLLLTIMKERDDAIKQRDFSREQLTHVTRLYNDLVERLERENKKEFI